MVRSSFVCLSLFLHVLMSLLFLCVCLYVVLSCCLSVCLSFCRHVLLCVLSPRFSVCVFLSFVRYVYYSIDFVLPFGITIFRSVCMSAFHVLFAYGVFMSVCVSLFRYLCRYVFIVCRYACLCLRFVFMYVCV